MRIVIAAVGRARPGPMRDLFEHYRRRITWPVVLKQVEERRPLPPDQLKAREAELLLAALPEGACVVALDAAGKALTSPQLARPAMARAGRHGLCNRPAPPPPDRAIERLKGRS